MRNEIKIGEKKKRESSPDHFKIAYISTLPPDVTINPHSPHPNSAKSASIPIPVVTRATLTKML
jgi:hypothetical protein